MTTKKKSVEHQNVESLNRGAEKSAFMRENAKIRFVQKFR